MPGRRSKKDPVGRLGRTAAAFGYSVLSRLFRFARRLVSIDRVLPLWFHRQEGGRKGNLMGKAMGGELKLEQVERQSGVDQVKITPEQRLLIEKRNRALLERELLEKRFVFDSRPYEGHIQYSNFCNMSCIMCHDGANPPLRKMTPEILQRVSDQVAPSLSIVIPYGGSEPLVVTWEEARKMAVENSFQFRLTTNVQFLDEERFHELKDITETLFLSIDSHWPELFEKIRPGAKPDRVYANVPTTAKLAREHGLECLGQVVFMTENASTFPETVQWLYEQGVESVNVLQLIDVNGRSSYLDPTIHFSAEYITGIKKKCIEIAKEFETRLIWNVAGWERHDYRKKKIAPKPHKDWNYRWEQRMKHYVPGYCMNVWDRLQVLADGHITPCCYATDGDLLLGNLAEQDFDDVWNSTNAIDLRRGMATWDFPSLCSTCRFTDRLPAELYLPFVADVLENIGRRREGVHNALVPAGPEHMARGEQPPTLSIETPEEEIETFYLGLGLGGESDQVEVCALEPLPSSNGTLEFEIPDDVWEKLTTNLGYWYAIFATVSGDEDRVLRSSEIRCLIRHESIARVEGSTLRYEDKGFLPVADLGGAKQFGWAPENPVKRPTLGKRMIELPVGKRHSRRKPAAGDDVEQNGHVPQLDYGELVANVKAVAKSALPPDATVAVVTKGDASLLELDVAAAWHFPCADDGSWLGYNPPDGGWAIEHLESLRGRGLQYLVFPSTSIWWLEHYEELKRHLDDEYIVAVEDDSCVIYSVALNPALYGRSREDEVRGHDRALAEELGHAVPETPDVVSVSPNGGPPEEAVPELKGPPVEMKVPPADDEAPPDRPTEAQPVAPPPASGPEPISRRAAEVLAYGDQNRVLLRPLRPDEEGLFPEAVASASGWELIDTRGRSFVDWSNGWGTVLLGYRHPKVEYAITSQLEAGPTVSLMHPVEVEVAELLTEIVPSAEMVGFGKNGSDVCAAAVRVARSVTGRELVFQHGFHGYQDWYTTQYRAKNVHGIPKALRAYIHPFPYNDLAALEKLFQRYPDEAAAVMMEPINVGYPEPGYLEAVRDLAHRNGALLIFDEVVTGFRLAPGGAQELFGVTPDLSCFSKAIANGMPLAALTGKREYMEHLTKTGYGITFRGETLSLAAARATLEVVRDQQVAEHLAQVGEQVRTAFNEIRAEEGVECELAGPPSRMSFVFGDNGGIDPKRVEELFVRELARNGVLSHGTLLPTFAHNDEAVDRTIRALREATRTVAQVTQTGRSALYGALRGGFEAERPADAAAPAEDAKLPAASLEVLREESPGMFKVMGWMLLEDGRPDAIEFSGPEGGRRDARFHPRPDLAEAFPGVEGADMCGFHVTLPASLFAHEGQYDFKMVAKRGDRPAFRCRVIRQKGDAAPYVPTLGDDGVLFI
jgi:glutamate-1-semialdehyde 2,1-aminomutase